MLLAELIDHANDDVLVVNAARVSLGKHHDEFEFGDQPGSDSRLLKYLFVHNHWTPFAHPQLAFHRELPVREALVWFANRTPGCETLFMDEHCGEVTLLERASLWFWSDPYNRALINGVHDSYIRDVIARAFPHAAAAMGVRPPQQITASSIYPVGMNILDDEWISRDPLQRARLPTLTFRVTAPMPIRTQCYKHKHGFVENEISGRYVPVTGGVFVPDTWRSAPASIKQGSGGPLPPEQQIAAQTLYARAMEAALEAQAGLQALGVCNEQARFAAPQATLTQWYWTASLEGLVRMVKQRCHAGAQAEVRQLAEQIAPVLWAKFPKTLERLLP